MPRPRLVKPRHITNAQKEKEKRLRGLNRGLSLDQMRNYEKIMVMFEYHWGFNEESYEYFLNNETFAKHVTATAKRLRKSHGVDTAIRYLAHSKASAMVHGDVLNSKVKKQGVFCPDCNSNDIGKDGRYNKKQRYFCKTCGRRFIGIHDNPENFGKDQDAVMSQDG